VKGDKNALFKMDGQKHTNIEEVEELLLRFGRRLTKLCARKSLGDSEDARDMLQNIMAEAWSRRDEAAGLGSDSEKERWLFSLARAEIFKHNSRRRFFERLFAPVSDPDTFAAESDPAKSVEELTSGLLSDDDMSLVRMKLEGYSFNDMAAVRRKTPEALRKQMQRIVEKIRESNNIKTKNDG